MQKEKKTSSDDGTEEKCRAVPGSQMRRERLTGLSLSGRRRRKGGSHERSEGLLVLGRGGEALLSIIRPSIPN